MKKLDPQENGNDNEQIFTQVIIPALQQETPNDYNPISNVRCVIRKKLLT